MERYDAMNRYHAWYEHWHRYHWIAPHLANKVVADLACGEGYGSALLANHAEQVWAVDLDPKTIKLAKEKYQDEGQLIFKAADVLNTPMNDHSMDVVVSFETLEHLSAHDELMLEFKRLLKPGGLVVISTPDKDVYSVTDEHNSYHVKELTAGEFCRLMGKYFGHVVFFGQQFQTNSAITQLQNNSSNTQALIVAQGEENQITENQQLPTYLIAIASDDPAAIEPLISLPNSTFNDAENSLFQHYEAQIERLLLADERMVALEQQIKQQSVVITQLQARLGL